MRKLSYFLLAAAGLLMASCSQQDLESPAVKGDGNYNVRVTLPGDMLTRSLGDGLTANKLLVAVYDADNNNAPVFQDITSYSFQAGQLTTTVSMNLVNGKTYNIAFFALSLNAFSNSIYNFDMGNGTITVNYASMTSDANIADSYDCFFKLHNTGKISEDSMDVNVTLTRPMAQINWGTDDLAQPAILNNYGENGQYIETTLTTEAYNVFDMFTGTTTGDKVDVTLANWASPISQTFPVSPYKYVAMSYLLAPATSDVYDLSLNITNDLNDNVAVHSSNTIEVSSAPVQANFRTNIYGTLLSDVVTFNVTKDPTWGDPDNNVPLTWDGTTKTTPAVDDDTKTVQIVKASDLPGFADLVSGGQDFDGYTVNLNADVDMSAGTFAGIGSASRDGGAASSGSTSFKGTFNGNGHTIYGLTIAGTSNADNSIGFIANLDGENAEVTNVTFDNLQINAPNNKQAGVVGLLTNGATVSNVNVTSGSIKAAQGAGGIVGRMTYSGTIDQCNNYATVSSSTNAGGIVGAAYYSGGDNVSMTVSNSNNYGAVSCTTYGGGIAGLSAANISNCKNYANVSGTSDSVGGVVGMQKACGSVKGCYNEGNVSLSNPGASVYGTGGIIGWVNYATISEAAAYPYQELIEVSGNTNKGSVSGNTGVGGIVGMWYFEGLCDSNTNNAPSISASGQFVAGIVGGSQWINDPAKPTFPAIVEDEDLTVSNNTSTTSNSNITGTSAMTIIYVNNTTKTVLSGNTPENTKIGQ